MIQQGEGQNLRQAAHLALVQCMGVSGGEKVLVITDEELREIGYAFWKEAKDLGAEAIFVEMIARSQHGEEPPEPVIEIMKAVDVIMAPTSRSLSHTGARRKANEAGARVASMPGITRDSAIRTLTADYRKIARLSEKMAEILSKGSLARITSPAGTDIVMSLEGRTGHPDTGIYHNPGDFGNLPAGEAFIAPVEGTAQGAIMYKGLLSMSGADSIYLYSGYDEHWANASLTPMTKIDDTTWSTDVTIDSDKKFFNFCFKDGADHLDNNSGLNWGVTIV
jgi:leucyl aminopeptidase (aminopeptidase T)